MADLADVKSAAGGVATVDPEAAAAAKKEGLKIPSDLSKVSASKARELAEAGVVEDRDLPGKFYKRKADGFTARIPDYTYEAYGQDLKDEWDEIKLTTDPEPPTEAA
jgi:hypothetical protein